MTQYEFHEVANIFPLIEGKEFDELVADVKKNGLLESIWLHGGKIIDGRNRYRACLEAGVAPHYREFEGKGSLIGFIISLNLKRRHLDAGQRALAALKAMPYFEAEAKERQKEHGGTAPNKPKTLTQKTEEVLEAAEQAAKAFNTNRQYIYEAKKIAAARPEQADKILRGQITFASVSKEMKHEERKAKIEAQKEEIKKLVKPNGKYGVIVIDPPWKVEGEYDSEGYRGVAGRDGYPMMSIDEIKSLKIPAEDDCILWLWGVDALLKETLEVIEAWGFERKSTLIWVKDKIGLGVWLRGQHEYCFLCVKGSPKHFGHDISTVMNGIRTKHSKKPDEFYALVEKYNPHPRKLDYFAREKREGWDVYGDEVKQ